ncbi:threonine-phosphate decarboxylase CobD [Marilutibacter aestuarii]|uniref:threonine-phosphate decarboxylase n=1 Tax=Marilutibacter aestuarii TaxID=1706195 RepID=A0A508ADW5_9GAMM|nr:threonine-phosphate decarboxylase CobD [Lysobacter aestuarii]TQD43992.1 threonine-phosphate decarboxylase [Lysobacter aestuarii]
MLEHGGRLQRAARQHGIDPSAWLDLSTGISPFAWPVPPVPPAAWQRLPEDDDGLEAIACRYYGAPRVLPVAGSQAAIQALPRLRGPSRVGVILPGYAEHAHAWRQAGHEVERLPAPRLLEDAARFDVIVLIHPNNPGGERFGREALLALHARLAGRGGWLVVDEAFMDATPGHSLCADSDREGLVVLRSVGKFFGLAGARAGFACASPALLAPLRERLGPWTLTGPGRYVLARALADVDWQSRAREWLVAQGERLEACLHAHGLDDGGGTAFFQWRRHPRASALHEALARRAVLTRLFDADEAGADSLRLGLPADAAGLERLDRALSDALREVAP